MADPDPVEAVKQFRQTLDESLRTHDSWLALAGLFWLEQGENQVGSDPQSSIVLNEKYAPPHLGAIRMDGEEVQLSILDPYQVKVNGKDQAQVVLLPDTSGSPTTVHYGPLTFMVIERAGRFALRLWDNSRTELLSFPGREWYAFDPVYRVRARFEQDPSPRSLQIVSTIGEKNDVPSAGRLIFSLGGSDLELYATGEPSAGLSILFKDLTNGDTTYSPGRYLTTGAVENGEVELDFNRAYNPPCAFTDFATCPLPPVENHLAVRIEAGEKTPAAYPR